jgi:hypothetical protein
LPSTSVFLENAILAALLNNTPFSVATVFVSAHTADPGQTGASEIVGGTYARVALTSAAPSAGSDANSVALVINIPASTTVTHLGLWDASSSGHFLIGGPLGTSEVFTTAGTLNIAIGALVAAATN